MQSIEAHAADCYGVPKANVPDQTVQYRNDDSSHNSKYKHCNNTSNASTIAISTKAEPQINYNQQQLNALACLNQQTLSASHTARSQDCPICGRNFPAECIAGHADICAMQQFG